MNEEPLPLKDMSTKSMLRGLLLKLRSSPLTMDFALSAQRRATGATAKAVIGERRQAGSTGTKSGWLANARVRLLNVSRRTRVSTNLPLSAAVVPASSASSLL